ncbi:MAG: hypothetical protein JXQ73_24485 [Phycisphaerae bacterium]|nr:hypothetical protein [Phycisphaerae bacterium]
MKGKFKVLYEVPKLYRIVALDVLRRTPGVSFDNIPPSMFPRIDALDRVIHDGGACSPGKVGDVDRPWYMHPHQDDNLVVLHGIRYVDIYTPAHGKMESFVVRPQRIEKDGEVLVDGPAVLVWPCGVFHRVRSCEVSGSASINFAVHYDGFDIRTNFSVYDLNTETGQYHVIREGHLDQPT